MVGSSSRSVCLSSCSNTSSTLKKKELQDAWQTKHSTCQCSKVATSCKPECPASVKLKNVYFLRQSLLFSRKLKDASGAASSITDSRLPCFDLSLLSTCLPQCSSGYHMFGGCQSWGPVE